MSPGSLTPLAMPMLLLRKGVPSQINSRRAYCKYIDIDHYI